MTPRTCRGTKTSSHAGRWTMPARSVAGKTRRVHRTIRRTREPMPVSAPPISARPPSAARVQTGRAGTESETTFAIPSLAGAATTDTGARQQADSSAESFGEIFGFAFQFDRARQLREQFLQRSGVMLGH